MRLPNTYSKKIANFFLHKNQTDVNNKFMAEKKTLKAVRLTPENVKRLRDYMRHTAPCPTIQNVVNFALQKFLLDEQTNNNKGQTNGT